METLSSEKITVKEYCCGRNTSLKPSAGILNVKDIPSSRFLFRLVPSERPTGGTGYGLLQDGIPEETTLTRKVPSPEEVAGKNLLPTPTACDATAGSILSEKDCYYITDRGIPRKINRNGTDGSIGLGRFVKLLPTPNASEATKYTRKYNPGSQMGTALTAMAMNNLLPTPRANKINGCDLYNPRIAEKNRGNLEEEIAKAVQSCGTADTLREYGKTSQLNPLFVEEMMGFPLMWTALPFLSHNGGLNQ